MVNMLKKTLALTMVCTSVMLFAACGSDSKQTVTIAHTQVESHPVHVGMVAFKNYIESKLGDKYEVLIYPEARLGANETVIKKVKDNEVQYLIVSTANLEPYDKTYALFGLPYLFSDEAVYEKFISSPKIIHMLAKDAEKNKFEPVAAFTSGTRSFYCKTPIKNLLDLQKKKVRIQAGPVNIAMILAFGAHPFPMSFSEVYGALEKNTIDCAENNEFALIDQKHGELAKYYTYDRHQMSPDFLIASRQFLSSLSADEAKIFSEAAAEAQKTEFASWHSKVALAKEEAVKMGVTFIDIDITEFKEKVLPLRNLVLEEDTSLQELYQEALNFEKQGAETK